MENVYDSITHAQNRDTNALQNLLVFQGTQVQNLLATQTTQVQNLVATQTMERTNALHAFERSQAAGKAYRV